MADLQYVQQNRITRDLDREVSSRRKVILAIGLPAAAVALLVAPLVGVVAAIGVAIAWAAAGAKDQAREVGAAGENYALKELSRLPESYTIFNQVEIPDDRSRTGLRELDFVVCGPNGVFVIESKNHNGAITGGEHDDQWTVHKVGRGGTPYTSSVRNPIRQVRGQVAVLNKYLRSRGLNPWITPIVTFSSNNDTSGIESGSITVTGTAELVAVIRNHRNRGPVQDVGRIVSALAERTLARAA